MRYLIILPLLALPMAALPILVNGSFDAPIGATQNIAGPFTIPGWTGLACSNGGNAGLVIGTDNGLSPYDGPQHFTFNGGNPADCGWIQQTFTTTPGAAYTLTYALGRAGGGQELACTTTLLDGATPFATLTAQPPANRTYQEFSYEFTAPGESTTLRFTDTSGPNSISDLYLDAAAVTQQAQPANVPDTTGAAELIITLGALLAATGIRNPQSPIRN